MSSDTNHVLKTAIQAARTGGQLALARLSHPGYEKRKGPRDVVAGAIPDIQERIVETIRQDFPDDHFLLEEAGGPQDVESAPLWLLFPPDGVRDFLYTI